MSHGVGRWEAACSECDFSKKGDFGDVFEAAQNHEDETSHDVEGEKVR